MSHPPETSRELAERIWVCADDHSLADDYPERWKEKAAALIEAWIRVREASAAVETATRWHDEIARRCGVEPKELPWTVQWLAEANDALATARKQLEGKNV